MSKQNNRGGGDNIYIEGDANFANQPKLPTNLAEIVNELANILNSSEANESNHYKNFDPKDKLSFNNVIAYEGIINAYKICYGKLNGLYKTFDIEGSNKKRIILKNLNTLYLKERDRLRKEKNISKQEVREQYSDLILENITKQLVKDIKSSNNLNITLEEAREGIYTVVVDGFVRCKILEKPNTN
jgi:hypothetical protein